MSIYATGISSSTPTPTPVPTSTPTPVPTSTPTPTPTLSSFGNSVIGTYTDQNDANAQSVSYFKAATTGSITDIMVYVSGVSSGKATAALYAVNGNSPGALLAQSSAVSIGTSSSWIDFQLSSACAVTAGTTYGLAIMGNVAVNLAIVAGTGQRSGGPGYGSFAKGFTNPFGTVWFNDVTGAMSIYATGISSSTPTPTPVPTSTPTPVPTSTPTPVPTSTPTPTPTAIPLPAPPPAPTPTSTPSPSSTNLAPLPNGWTESLTGSRGIGDSQFGSKIIYPVTQSGYSNCLELLAYDSYPYVGLWGYGSREIDSAWTSVQPGDTVVFSAWIWTDASTIGDNDVTHGAKIGMDAYSSGGRLCQINNDNSVGTPTYNGVTYNYNIDSVGWGSGTWIHMSMTWVVPNSVYYDGFGTASNVFGQAYAPTAIIAWIGSGAPDHAPIEGAAMYVRDIELCINP
jgi:hypothetical protein